MESLGLTDAPLDSLTGEWLGISDHIEALVTFISKCNTPMTISIQGDWGTGKTSMMKLVKDRLRKMGIITVWFNTWQFSQFNMQEDVPVALLMELLRNIEVKESTFTDMAWGIVKKLTVAGATLFYGKNGKEAASGAFADDPVDIFAQIRELRKTVQDAINAKLAASISDRIVIFVDDLDRMNPGKAVELLEVIKNFLDLKGCVFVLAVDYEVVSAGARIKYGEEMDKAKGRSFFDKIIQLPFNLPVSQYTTGRYLKNILKIPDGEVRYYEELASTSIGKNPRALKRIANIKNLLEILAAKNYADNLKKLEFRRLLFAIICLQMAYEPVYNEILASEDVTDFIKASPAEREAKFASALDKLPGKKEEAQARLAAFMDSLMRTLPQKEGEDHPDFNLFRGVLAMSGLTASNGNVLREADNVKNSFDPRLLAEAHELCAELATKFRSFWDMLEALPVFRMSNAQLTMPVLFGSTVEFGIHLKPDGMYVRFYSNYTAPAIKRPFYELLKKILPDYSAKGSYSGGAGAFIDFPFIEWNPPITDDGEEASRKRLEQVKKTLAAHTDIVIPALDKICRAQLPALDKTHGLLARIAGRLASRFTVNDGWELTVSERGVAVLEGVKMLEIKKHVWPEGISLILKRDGYGIFAAISRKANGKNDEKIYALIRNHWFESMPDAEENSTGQEPGLAFYAYLPTEIKYWTKGRYLFPDFSFALDVAREEKAWETVCNYFFRFLSLEKEIDEWAAKQP